MATAEEITQAAQVLHGGGLVAFPTETVYGLGADARNEAAVRRLFAAKGRPADHPVIVHIASAAQLGEWAREIPDAARKLADAFWPGPLTLIVPRAAGVLDVVTGGQESVGVRVPRHPVSQALLRAFGGGVAAPSANRFGRISPTRAAHVRAEFDAATVPIILDGDPPDVGVESTIVDCTGPRPTLLRPGGITPAQLAAVLGEAVAAPTAASPRASGTLKSHYAPTTPLEIVPGGSMFWRAGQLRDQGKGSVCIQRSTARKILGDLYYYQGVSSSTVAPLNGKPLTMPTIEAPPDAEQYTQYVYQMLRDADIVEADRILIEDVPEGEEWLAVRDRLRRAAAKPD